VARNILGKTTRQPDNWFKTDVLSLGKVVGFQLGETKKESRFRARSLKYQRNALRL
jgi:hypothetical protein